MSSGQNSAAPKPPVAPPCTIVIFGASGDLTKRLLMPALYDLVGDGLLGDDLAIVGVDHTQIDTAQWRDALTQTMQSFATEKTGDFRPDKIDDAAWSWVTSRLEYVVGDFTAKESYADLKRRLDARRGERGNGNAVFYLAVSARFFAPIVENLGAAGMLQEAQDAFRRVIIEKPFGADLASARELNRRILAVAAEQQIYRIDHFLGKEPVQSIMALRFGNGLFEPMWRREHVEHVQITAAETIGVEKRGGFYEATGALRDMVPNHLFALLTMVTMEPPNSFEPEAVRTEKVKLAEAIRPIALADAVRGQYATGTIAATAVPGYRQEPDVAPASRTDTYAAVRVAIENWRWSGVPFYLRTGKRLAQRSTTISIAFKSAPYRMFRDTPVERLTPNVLTLQISPEHGMTTDFSAKIPGPVMALGRVRTQFQYGEFFEEKPDVGYETLIYDCMIGDATLFQRADNIEAGWAAVDSVLEAWSTAGEPESYPAGSAGPAAADELLARDGRRWMPLGPQVEIPTPATP